MDLEKTVISIWTFLEENWVILAAVVAATVLVRAVTMFLVNIACTRIVGEIEERGKTPSGMSPASIESLKEMLKQEHRTLSWILSRKYILEECFDRLKDEGIIFWSDELKTYRYGNRSRRLS